MEKLKYIPVLLILLFTFSSEAQVGIGTNSPNSSAKLDVSSTSKGLLPPRMTYAQKNTISSPAAGLMVWCTDCGSSGQMQVFNGSAWTDMIGSTPITATSNGTAVVSAYTISGTSTGTLTTSLPATGATQTIIATVISVGTYNISSTSNGVTFAAAGTFSATGNQNVVLTASGTPTNSGSNSFTINTTPSFSFTKTVATFVCGSSTVTFTYNGSSVTYGTVSSTGSTCWLDRNLGASQVATSSSDVSSYGDLFQWGRGADGHQVKTSITAAGPSNSTTPGSSFLTVSTPSNWYNGTNPSTLWQGVNGTNNPCPSGFRIPTEVELNGERISWGVGNQNPAGAFASPLKLTVTGFRYDSGSLHNSSTEGLYWSSSISSTSSRFLYFDNVGASMNTDVRAYGFAVRCIKN